MNLKKKVTEDLIYDKIIIQIGITKESQENIDYLLNEFNCETIDELINLLLYHAAITEYTEKIKKEINE